MRHYVPILKAYEIQDDPVWSVQKSVLLLEDGATLAHMLRSGLEMNNYAVTRARNGAEGIQCILKRDYDFLLCDMIMPGFPGDMFYRAVERNRPHLCRRFLFMTGHHGNAQIDDFIRSVRGSLIWKPFRLHELLEALDVVARKTMPEVAA